MTPERRTEADTSLETPGAGSDEERGARDGTRIGVRVTPVPGCVRVAVDGELCAETAHSFHRAVDDAVPARTGKLVIDLAALTAIDPVGAEALLVTRVRYALERVAVSVVPPAPELQAVIEGAGTPHLPQRPETIRRCE